MPNKIVSNGRFSIFTGNKPEQMAFKRLYDREASHNEEARLFGYRRFRKEIRYDTMNGCFMVKRGGIYIGIESDGYTHS